MTNVGHGKSDENHMPANLCGAIIGYNEIDTMVPSRYESLCADNPDSEIVDNCIASNSNILFHPVDVRDYQAWDDDHLQYYVQMFGPLLNGQKACIMVKINPFFDIKLPAKKDHDKLRDDIEKSLIAKGWNIIELEFIKAREYMGYKRHRTTFVRVHMHSSSERRKAITFCRDDLGYELNSVDGGSQQYYRVVEAQNEIKLATWVNITKYDSYSGHARVKIPKVFMVSIDNLKTYDGDILKNKSMRLDKTVCFTWDIETYKDITRTDAEPPFPEENDSGIFQISINANIIHDAVPYLNILITTCPQSPEPNTLVVICDDEKQLLKSFADIFEKICPDISNGFNTGYYDWPWVKARMETYELTQHFANKMSCVVHKRGKKQTRVDLEEMIIRYNYVTHRVKLDADTTMLAYSLCFPGCIDYDLMPMFRKTHMKQCESAGSYKLNFFLEMYGLPLKDDMLVNTMFDAYDAMNRCIMDEVDPPPELLTLMTKIGKYCCRDSRSTFNLTLVNSGNSISDLREIANMSYTSLNDAIWYAGAMKVRNLIITEGSLMGYSFNTHSEYGSNREKYIGGYVSTPRKGVAAAKLSFRERSTHNDHHERYKNISEECINSMEYIILNNCDPEMLKKLNTPARHAFDEFIDDEQHHPVFALDYSSLYPSIIIAFNIDPTVAILDRRMAKKLIKSGKDLYHSTFEHNGQKRESWYIRHDGNEETMAVGPRILLRLFRERSQLKKKLKRVEHAIELIEAGKVDECLANPDIAEFAIMPIEELTSLCRYIDSKQKARKTIMNTFYGVMGDCNNPFFGLEYAAAVTSTGQRLIKFARDVALNDRHCKQYYGDSVTGDTPLVVRCRDTGMVMIKTIDALTDKWVSYDQFKPGEPGLIEKQQAMCTLQIWTDGNWYDINKVIRHKTNKKMYRINTHTGVIDVTQDHSLMTPDHKKIKPSVLKIGTELLHSFPNVFHRVTNVTKGEAYALGSAMSTGLKHTVLDIPVPMHILNSSIETRQAFYDGYCSVDGCCTYITCIEFGQYTEFCCKGKITSQCMYYLLQSLGHRYVRISCTDNPDIYLLNVFRTFHKNPIAVEKILELPPHTQNEFVYDIETSRGSFLGGVGSLNCSNTDSIYVSCNPDLFKEMDRLYYGGMISKEEYYEKCVLITMKEADVANKHINTRIAEEVGNAFIKMAFEEVLWPAVFLVRKVYFGIAHTQVVNFNLKFIDDAFMKGLSIVKRDTSPMQVKLTSELVLQILNIRNTKTMKSLVLEKIEEAYTRKWDVADFVKSATYKPARPGKPGNRAILRFVERMRELGRHVPRPSDRIQYVIAKEYPWSYDFRGCQTKLSMGDKIWYPEDIDEMNKEIDMSYYMTNQVSGQFAQFLTYCNEFHVDPVDDSNDALKEADRKITANAKAWIKSINDQNSPEPINKGSVLKQIYRRSTEPYYNKVDDAVSKHSAKLFKSKLGDESAKLYDNTMEDIRKAAEKSAANYADKFIAHIIKEHGIDYLYTLKILYGTGSSSIHNTTRNTLNLKLDEAKCEFLSKIDSFQLMFDARNHLLGGIVDMASHSMSLDTLIPFEKDELPNALTDDRCEDAVKYAAEHDVDIATINLYSELYTKMYVLYMNIAQSVAILKEIDYHTRGNKDARPPTIVIEDEIKASAEFIANMKTIICDM